jgi:hypothetical protein
MVAGVHHQRGSEEGQHTPVQIELKLIMATIRDHLKKSIYLLLTNSGLPFK